MGLPDVNEIIKLFLFALAAIFGITSLVFPLFGLEILKAGLVIQTLLIFAAILLVWNIVSKKNFDFDKTDIVAVLLVGSAIITIFVLLPTYAPQMFSTLGNNVQSVLG
jgi:uncharacterized membrane protein